MRDIQQIAPDVIADVIKLSPTSIERIRQMARHLKNLRIDEVSSVDRGAGEGVKVVLIKRLNEGATDDVVIDFNAMRKALAAKPENADQIDQAVGLLRKSIESINADSTVIDKAAAIGESVKQFHEHIAGLAPVHKEDSMTPEQIAELVTKSVTEAVAKATKDSTDRVAKLELDLQFERLPQAHKDFCKAMSADDKKKFMDKKTEDRDADCKKAADAAAGDPVVKALSTENVELKKRLSDLEDANTLAICKADAKNLGMTDADAGEVLMKSRRGDAEAIKKVEAHMASLIKQRDEIAKTGKVFKEFGSSQGGSTTAYDQIVAKAAELRKADSKLTEAQAFDKAYNDPANMTLREQHKSEEMAKRGAIAA